jgi:hypothetical protein
VWQQLFHEKLLESGRVWREKHRGTLEKKVGGCDDGGGYVMRFSVEIMHKIEFQQFDKDDEKQF